MTQHRQEADTTVEQPAEQNTVTSPIFTDPIGLGRPVEPRKIPSGRTILVPSVDLKPLIPDGVLGDQFADNEIDPDLLRAIRKYYVEKGDVAPPTGTEVSKALENGNKRYYVGFTFEDVLRYAGVPTLDDVLELWAYDRGMRAYGRSAHFRPNRLANDFDIPCQRISRALTFLQDSYDDRDTPVFIRSDHDGCGGQGGKRRFLKVDGVPKESVTPEWDPDHEHDYEVGR